MYHRRPPRSAWATGVIALLVVCLTGCPQPTEPPQPKPAPPAKAGLPPKPASEPKPAPPEKIPLMLDAGTHVTLLSQKGSFSLVETSEGRQLHVPSERLVGTRDSGDNKEYAVTCNTEVFEGAPPDKVPGFPPPRAGTEITAARDKLPVLFLTPSGREVQLTRQAREPSFDPETKELLWRAMTCTNPDCPGKDKGKNGRPFLFICPDPTYEAGSNGPVIAQPKPGEPAAGTIRHLGRAMHCPECLKIRDLAAENDEQRQRYQGWRQTYLLPEAKARGEQLNREHGARIELNRREGREGDN